VIQSEIILGTLKRTLTKFFMFLLQQLKLMALPSISTLRSHLKCCYKLTVDSSQLQVSSKNRFFSDCLTLSATKRLCIQGCYRCNI